MRLAWLFARRDLRGSKAGLRLLALCLFLGVAALAGIGSLSSAILGGLGERGQTILGGDIQFETAQRTASSQERAAMEKIGRVSETVRMRAMAAKIAAPASAGVTDSVLAELKGVDGNWPLYGALKLAPGALGTEPKGLDVVVAPSLMEKLALKTGDTIRVGEAQFRIIGVIAEEPDRTGEGFTLGPVILADMEGVTATQLVQPGSLYNMKYRVETPASTDIVAAAQRFVRAFPEGGWETANRTNGAPGTRRFVERLGQFLALVGLTALAIAGIGVGNGVTSWLDEKRASIATLKTLGASSGTVFRTYLLEIGLVASAAIAVGLMAGAGLPWLIVALAGDRLPVVPSLSLYPVPLALAALFGLLIALLFSLAPLARARAVRPASLFRGGIQANERPAPAILLAILLTGAAITALAITTAVEPKFAAIFVASVLALLLLLAGLGWGIRRIAAALPRPRAPLARLALANLHRPGAQTGRLVVALGLGLTLFATLAVIQTSLANQIASTIPERAPSFFALDIPKDDEARFRNAVTAIAPKAEIRTVPMLRGPVVAVGDKRVSEMASIPAEAWFLRGDRGLTFARDLPPGSQITAGQWWPKDYAGSPLVSLDVEIEATIASLRAINWDTMGFNFVLVFSPGTLESAPFTMAATITADAKAEAGISRAVGQGFPAVSMIQVKDVISQVGTLLGQLASAISIAAGVAVLAGIAVLVGAIAAARRSRSYDAVLLKLLGATRGQVLAVQAMEYALLALILSGVALAIGSAAGWFAVTRLFDFEWTPDWPVVIATVAAGGLGTLVLGLLGTIPVLRARPAAALRDL
jgi:putative ABC transport system permease protein